MENFNTVPNQGKFGDSIAVVNENFLLAQQEMEVLQNKCENESARAQATEEELREYVQALSQSKPVPKTAAEWAAMTSYVEGVIYRVAGTTSYADYMYNGTTTVKMAEYDNAIDNEPTASSNNLAKSGGIRTAIDRKGEITSVINPYILNRVSPDYQKVNSNINSSGQWVTTNYYTVYWFYLTQGQTLYLKFRNVSVTNNYALQGYWLTTKPVFGETDFTDKIVFSIPQPQDANWKYVEYYAKEDGYLVIRDRSYSSNGYQLISAKYMNYAELAGYVRETITNIPAKREYGIDCDVDSATYGEEVPMAVAGLGCTDYIDISMYSYLYLFMRQTRSSAIGTYLYGTMYYDANKQPLSVAFIYQCVGDNNHSYMYSTVPSGAKYIRVTTSASNKRADGTYIVENIYGFKKLLGDYTNEQEARIESIENALQRNIKTKTVTLVPQPQCLYSGFINVDGDKSIKNSSTRITYTPEIYTIGGTQLKVHYTGAHNKRLRVIQYTMVPLNSPLTSFTADKCITHTAFPSSNSESFTGEATLTLDKNCKRVMLYMTAGDETVIPLENILDYITDIEVEQQDGYVTASEDSGDNRVEQLVRQSRFVADSGEVTATALTLIHCTDIHEDDTAVERILSFANKGLSEDILCTGDLPSGYPSSTSIHIDSAMEWIKACGLMEKALFTMGNHDSATYENRAYDWLGRTQQQNYEDYFAPYIQDVGYIMPSNHASTFACYWHKDYVSQKIRLIGLDCMYRCDGIVDPVTGQYISGGVKKLTSEQEEWFVQKLNETLDENNAAYGYSVVVACHYPLDDFSGSNEQWDEETHKFIYNQNENGGRVMSYKTTAPVNFHKESVSSIIMNSTFNMRNRTTYPSKGDVNNMAEILSYWISQGGKFVAWLCGHNHNDYMFYTKYKAGVNDILVITNDQAGTNRPPHSGVRNNKYNDGISFNIVTIDTQNGLIKLVRNGFNTNKFLNSHQYMCYDYINRKVLNEG